LAKVRELGFELLPHPPYSPDLAPDRSRERARARETATAATNYNTIRF
ncbi:hypothetical protein ALC57_14468, partial [Trachymyrmex cornetzi]